MALSLSGMKLVETNWGVVKVEVPPHYWVAPNRFPGIDAALVLAMWRSLIGVYGGYVNEGAIGVYQ